MRQIMINLDYQSRTPIYEQIVDGVEKYVALGILKEKTQIPSIREMASSLGINPNTVKKSYDILEGRGVITTISTKGTFISEDTKKATNEKINKEISIIREKIDELTKMGISYEEVIGEFVAIVGSSGSGKSTLLHILGAVDKPTSGKVVIGDVDVFKQKDDALAVFRRRKVGLIYQFYNLIPILNVEENMTLPILLDGKSVDKNYLKELIDILGLERRINHLPNELSGGQQQRVSIGRALISRPDIILADEPTGNLDSKASREIMDLLRLSNEKYGQTIIMITHDMNLAKTADRIITLEDGHIVKDEKIK